MSRARRLFFALWPDDAVRHALLHWQTENLAADVRWQHRADLHVTLHFLGSVDAGCLDALQALGERVVARQFRLILDQIGYWPRPQVLWCGPAAPPAELLDLHALLEHGLAALGLPTESRPFRPHLTLARKVPRGGGFGALPPVDWTVREWALVESRPRQMPLYRPLWRWSLK